MKWERFGQFGLNGKRETSLCGRAELTFLHKVGETKVETSTELSRVVLFKCEFGDLSFHSITASMIQPFSIELRQLSLRLICVVV